MRRTLTVLVASAALLVPATAASANDAGTRLNASCSSGVQRTGTYSLGGNLEKALAGECAPPAVSVVAPPPPTVVGLG